MPDPLIQSYKARVKNVKRKLWRAGNSKALSKAKLQASNLSAQLDVLEQILDAEFAGKRLFRFVKGKASRKRVLRKSYALDAYFDALRRGKRKQEHLDGSS